MRQIWIPKTGDPSVLDIREAPDPDPAPGEVRIAVEAAGVNFADAMARMGLYPDCPPLPTVVGYEVAGDIDAVGEGVDTRLIGKPAVAMCRFGGYASFRCVPAIQAAIRPDGLDAITAASIPVVGTTAWMMLEVMGRVREGDRVLVHSAGGGVGLMALDLIKRRGGHAIGTASPGKHKFLRERGYDELIDYRNHDFEHALAGQPGLDLILDPIGGDSWAKGLRLLRAGGRLICFGMSANATSDTWSPIALVKNITAVPWLKSNPIALINENKGIMGVNMGHMWHEGERVSSWLRALLVLWENDEIRPHIHATVPFDNAAEAHRILHDRENFGKVILTT
jgi:NADPH:quinone reductase-like Zn-dependent oxidoreductase